MKLLLLGPPGAGKGTLGQALSRRFDVPHVSAGDIIRDHIARGTEFGRGVAAQIADGNFASDEDICYWVSRRLEGPDAAQGYVLDGFPRALSQAVMFEGALDAVIWLQIEEAERQSRLAGRLTCPSCGAVYHHSFLPPVSAGVCDREGAELIKRPEDSQDSQRLRIYRKVTAPLESFYHTQGICVPVDASGEPGQVMAQALAALADRLQLSVFEGILRG